MDEIKTRAQCEDEGVYKVPTYRLEELREKFAKLNRRATKLGVPGVSFEIVRTYKEEKRVPPSWDEFGQSDKALWVRRVTEYADVRFQGETPKMAGWEFVGVIEPLGKDANMLRIVPGVEGVPEKYRTAGGDCDHCHAKRRRKETYLVRFVETGEFKQVGSTCIEDFLGGLSPDQILAALEIILEAVGGMGDDDDFDGMGRGQIGYNVSDFLSAVSAFVQKNGYISRKAADEDFSGRKSPTGGSVFRCLSDRGYEFVYEQVDKTPAAV